MTKARSNAVANAAKGDLTVGTGTNLSGILPVSATNGDTIVADSSTSTGLRYQENYAAGKNKIINGAFDNWQRGSTTTLTAATKTYLADRFSAFMDTNAGTFTYSRQTFTPGTAPFAGYEGQFFARLTTGGNCNMTFNQPIEDVRTFAGQTITFSFFAKSSIAKTFTAAIAQDFGAGGSTYLETSFGGYTTSTSWQRFTFTATMPSVSGKTIGTSSHLLVRLATYGAQTGNFDVDYWGVQVEDGSVATAFQTATGTIQGETSACQRYLPAFVNAGSATLVGGYSYATNNAIYSFPFPVNARVAPTGITLIGNFDAFGLNTAYAATPAFNGGAINAGTVIVTSGLTITAGQGSRLATNGAATILFTGCEL